MFKIAVQTGGLEQLYGTEGTYRAIREAGFDAVDANINRLFFGAAIRDREPVPAFLRKEASDLEVVEAVKPWREAAKKYGLENEQAHAPFPSLASPRTPGEEAYNDAILEAIRKCIIAAASMDCRNLVVHPFYYTYETRLDPAEERAMNLDRFMRLAPTAKEYGVTICVENMQTAGHGGKRFACTANTPYEHADYVDTLNELASEAGLSKVFGACFDTGHAFLAGNDVKNYITYLGDRIACFHVHDNNGVEDDHIAPYAGKSDWDRFVEALAEINFRKTLSFETVGAVNRVDPALVPNVLRIIERTGRLFDRKAEEYSAKRK